jgi:predicted nucleic acid-binding protein
VICADTSFLLSLEGNDSNSAAAVAQAQALKESVQITALTRLEFENAIRLLRFRGAIPEDEASVIFASLAADEQGGRIVEASCDWPAVLGEALRLSRERAEDEGHRVLDILHVAVALKLGAARFLSFDQQQRELAAAEGLDVGP